MPEKNNFQVLLTQINHGLHLLRREGVFKTTSKFIAVAKVSLRSFWCLVLLNIPKRHSDISSQVDLVLKCEVLRSIQVRSELVRMLELVREEKPRTLVEIGTAGGGTLCLLCRVAEENALIVSIDLPNGEYGGGYPEWKMPVYKAFARKSQKVHLLRGDSHSEVIREELRHILAGREIEFLFIDGDHTYLGVQRDFELYSPFVADGGLIAFHDIAPLAPSADYGVRRFWDELKRHYETAELVEDPSRCGYGIGVLKKRVNSQRNTTTSKSVALRL